MVGSVPNRSEGDRRKKKPWATWTFVSRDARDEHRGHTSLRRWELVRVQAGTYRSGEGIVNQVQVDYSKYEEANWSVNQLQVHDT